MYKTEMMDKILKSPMAQQIIQQVSPIYGEAYTVLWLYQIIGTVLDQMQEWTDSLAQQRRIKTATWSIPYWEEQYGITPDASWDLEQRRQNVIAAKRYKAPINPKKMEDLISAIVGLPVTVTENIRKNTFLVNIEGYTQEYARAVANIENMKPAHLIYEIKVSEMTQSKLNVYSKILVSEQTEYSVFIEE